MRGGYSSSYLSLYKISFDDLFLVIMDDVDLVLYILRQEMNKVGGVRLGRVRIRTTMLTTMVLETTCTTSWTMAFTTSGKIRGQ